MNLHLVSTVHIALLDILQDIVESLARIDVRVEFLVGFFFLNIDLCSYCLFGLSTYIVEAIGFSIEVFETHLEGNLGATVALAGVAVFVVIAVIGVIVAA